MGAPPPKIETSCLYISILLFDVYTLFCISAILTVINKHPCNHLAKSYSQIPNPCAFDCYNHTNTCIQYFNFSWAVLFVIKSFFFVNTTDTKIHVTFHFLSGVWSNPPWIHKQINEKYKFHILTISYNPPPPLQFER